MPSTRSSSRLAVRPRSAVYRAVAYFASLTAERVCFASVATIAGRAALGAGGEATQRQLRALEVDGHIEAVGGRSGGRNTTRYRLILAVPNPTPTQRDGEPVRGHRRDAPEARPYGNRAAAGGHQGADVRDVLTQGRGAPADGGVDPYAFRCACGEPDPGTVCPKCYRGNSLCRPSADWNAGGDP